MTVGPSQGREPVGGYGIADQNRDIAEASLGDVSGVDHELVHADHADDRAFLIAEEDDAFVAESAGVAVAVARADGENSGGAGGGPGGVVAHLLSWIDPAFRRDAGLEGHDLAEAARHEPQGIDAVSEDADTNHRAASVRPFNGGGAVCGMDDVEGYAGLVHVVHDLVEGGEEATGPFVVVAGVGEVLGDADKVEAGEGLDRFGKGDGLVGTAAEAVKAGVNLKVNSGGSVLTPGGFGDGFGDDAALDGDVEVVEDGLVGLNGEDRGKDDDAALDAGVAEGDAFGNGRDSEKVYARAGGHAGDGDEAVPVGVSFGDEGEADPFSNLRFQREEIVAQSVQVDFRPGARIGIHKNIVSYRAFLHHSVILIDMAGRRTEILEAAYNLMGTQGLESVHARTVAAKLKINHATVHYYFRTRPELLAGIAEYAVSRLAADRKAVGEAATPGDTVENEMALAEAYSRRNSRFAKVLLALTAALPSTPELRDPLMTLWAAWRAPLEDAVPKAKFRRSSPYNDAETLAAQLFGLMASAHMTDGEMAVEQKLDQIFDSLFKA